MRPPTERRSHAAGGTALTIDAPPLPGRGTSGGTSGQGLSGGARHRGTRRRARARYGRRERDRGPHRLSGRAQGAGRRARPQERRGRRRVAHRRRGRAREPHGGGIAASVGLVLDGMLVEAMAPPGVEMIVGAKRDPGWGPVLLVGLGGIWTEALDDVRLMPADLAREQVDRRDRLRSRARACCTACAAPRRSTSARSPTWRCASAR